MSGEPEPTTWRERADQFKQDQKDNPVCKCSHTLDQHRFAGGKHGACERPGCGCKEFRR
jgi:hypothetical protein